jgi:hypothetical protein
MIVVQTIEDKTWLNTNVLNFKTNKSADWKINRKKVKFMDKLNICLQQYLDPKMPAVVAALLILGFFLKQTPLLKDWYIIWILTICSLAAALTILGPTVEAFIQGILAAGNSVYAHQLIKQSTNKRKEDKSPPS